MSGRLFFSAVSEASVEGEECSGIAEVGGSSPALGYRSHRGYHDELSFRRPFRVGSLQFSNSCGPAGGNSRASSPTCGFPKERAASHAPPPLRLARVGCVVPILVRLAA